MSNYSVVKTATDAYIKRNGRKEITGPILNNILNAIIDSLGKYYQFVGVASPATNPGTPDENVAYLAATAGTYPNMGGETLSSGEIAVLLWNGEWEKQTVFVMPSVSEGNVFIATYGVTSFGEMKTAYVAGKVVIVKYGDATFFPALMDAGGNEFHFFSFDEVATYYYFMVSQNDGWGSISHEDFVQWGSVITSWPTTPTDYTIPSSKLVKDSIDAKYEKPSDGIPSTDMDAAVQTSLGKADTAVQPGDLAAVATSGDYDDLINKPTIPADKVYICDYGVATLADVSAAAAAGKVVICKASLTIADEPGDCYLPLVRMEADYAQFCMVKGRVIYNASIDDMDTWSLTSEDLEEVAFSGDYDDLINKPTIPADKVYIATYGSTTYAEILAAYNAGKAVFVNKSDEQLMMPLILIDATNASFGGEISGYQMYFARCSSSDVWSKNMYSCELLSNRVSSWQATPTNTKYPTEKLVKDSIDAVDQVFWATYGTTTFADCLAEYNAGKIVAVIVNGQYVEILCRVQASAITFACHIGTYLYRAQVSSADVWSNNSFENEIVSNKVTTIDSSSVDGKYPSAKAVYDFVKALADANNLTMP